ncbi:hypothetical protein CFC21_081961 [Triticum aestivum]|uniref:Uncharacterized protein n=2 Tax=Triticum aestivum TaxID=4565 RepID=A0A3B6NL49_WHEAT|nr:hypothetical protein CFC21_081961 [Triticum aestivum]
MCLEAQHRLAFERRHGSDTFPYYIPDSTATDLVKRCKAARVWNRKDGATIDNVLKQIQRAGGAEAWPDQDGWGRRCNLQVKSWETWSFKRLPSASSLARMIRTEGPLIGGLVVGEDYYADGWEKRVYRGGSGKKAGPHGVVCTGYRYEQGEEKIQVVENHDWDGPARWIYRTAFTDFTQIKVEPLDASPLFIGKEVSWWRRLERRLWREETCWWLRRHGISEQWNKTMALDMKH